MEKKKNHEMGKEEHKEQISQLWSVNKKKEK